MNVLLISQCSKRALTETRRVLDQFAERRGDRTWQTPITWEGLATLRKLLKKSARKNTAVSCHWIRGKDYSELLWVVGDASRFNADGAVPTNSTSRDVLRTVDENDWHTLEALALLAGISGLFHDFGKANKLFQNKLNPKKKSLKSEPLRHEWLSMRLFLAFVGELEDQEWLKKLSCASPEMEETLLLAVEKDKSVLPKNPFAQLAARPMALAVAWLVVSHHRLPTFARRQGASPPLLSEVDTWLTYDFNAGWNSPQLYDQQWGEKDWDQLWDFPAGTPLRSTSWCKKAQSLGKKALRSYNLKHYLGLQDLFTSHLARLMLMLADHVYSASDPVLAWQDKRYKVYANTDRETGALKQRLDEHTIGVGHHAYLLAKKFPDIRQGLPALTRVKALKKRTTDARFRWQDKAWDLARSLAAQSEQQGFFGINLASTGCGKTFANAKIMYGLSNESRGCRFSVALGLRTLTLQTGDALIERLQLTPEDLAVLVGSQAVKELHQRGKSPALASNSTATKPSWEEIGSESGQALFEDDSYVRYDGALDDTYLGSWLQKTPKLHQLVSAPILVSTIDHLMPATEGIRGGKQIAPMLRLLTADLVLDEPDDFGLEDLPALCRLVHWAGLLGSKVLLSSATLPPALVEALFAAYQAGWKSFKQVRGEKSATKAIVCAWFDEFDVASEQVVDQDAFVEAHKHFIKRRLLKLNPKGSQARPLRLAELLPASSVEKEKNAIIQAMAGVLHEAVLKLHHRHGQDSGGPCAGKKVSFGLIRMANINPLVAVAQELLTRDLPPDHRLHFCVYHGQYPLLMRSKIESVLDLTLSRSVESEVWQQASIQRALNNTTETHHIFLVLGSSVTEVGRDHDYDWAIAEPSSMRSLIQLAGRIQRHRQRSPASPNMLILSKNFKALQGDALAYCRPGFESAQLSLRSHDLSESLEPEQYQYMNAAPRLLSRDHADPRQNLVDLEHAQLRIQLFGGQGESYAARWWQDMLPWSGEFQRRTPFRQSTEEELFLLYQEEEWEDQKFYQWLDDGELISQDQKFSRSEWQPAERVLPWVRDTPEELIKVFSEVREEEVSLTCKRFMQVRLRTDNLWMYHPLLGIYQTLEG